MSTRSVIVRLEAEVSRYVAGMGAAASATDNVARRVVNTRRNIADQEANMEKAGGTLLKFGAVGVAALGASAKAAMDWESAWTGVKKTVDGTPEQLKAVEGGLRGLAKTLPSTHTEIAAVAEAAGQLGIQTGNVVAFTKTMIDLGESTNLSAEEAATGLARFSNVMGTAQGDVGKLGATLVGLGNNFATTEAEILAMGMRLAGVGQQVGLTEGQVLGLSAAMSSVGIEAEAGGTAMSMVIKKISNSVDEGGADVAEFARISGMSASEFSAAWKKDAGSALVSFTEGLGEAGVAGESVNTMLSDLGIKGIRETDTLLRLSAAGKLMGTAMTSGSDEYRKGTALLEEANKRYATSASKMSIAWNKIKDSAIDAGAVILPAITGIVEGASGLVSAFSAIPEPVQGTIVILGVAGTALLLVGGGLLTLIPKIAATRAAFAALSTSGGTMVGSLGKIAKGLGIAGLALVAFQIANQVASREVEVSSEKMTAAIIGVTDASKGLGSLDSVFSDFGSYFGKDLAGDVNGVADAVSRVVNPEVGDGFQRGIDGMLGWTGLAKSETTTLDNRFKELGVTMGEMAKSGNTEAASKAFRELAKEFEANGSNAADALSHLPGYENALIGLANQAGTASDKQSILNMAIGDIADPVATAAAAQEVLQTSLDETGVGLSAVAEDMDKFLESLFAAGIITMSSREAQFAYQESLRGVGEQVQKIIDSNGAMGATLNETGDDFNKLSDAGKLANDTLQGIAQDGMAQVESMSKDGLGQAELQAKMADTYEDLIDVAGQFGLVGDGAVNLARDVLGVPDGVDIKTWMDDVAAGKSDLLAGKLDALNGRTVTTTVRTMFEQYGTPYANVPDPSNPVFGPLDKKATGGPITGPGTGTSDEVLMWGSNGEHMLTAAEVQMMGGHDSVYRFRAGLQNGGVPAYAGGGGIGSIMTPARQLAPAGPGGNLDYDKLAAAIGPRIDMSGGNYTALDPAALKREVMDDLSWKLRSAGLGVGRL